MESDRELLELAAKAAGLSIDSDDEGNPVRVEWFRKHLRNEYPWNPITDDGDALRLAVKLQFRVLPPEDEFGLDRASVRIRGRRELIDAFDQDANAATRRAIVQAAAEIGRQMLAEEKSGNKAIP